MAISLEVNGATRAVDVDPDTPLLWVLRDVLGMTGTKFGRRHRAMRACTVHLDGNPVRSCLLAVVSAMARAITTIEGKGAAFPILSGAKVQKAWLDLEVIQCGYCQSGQIMSAAALLTANSAPDDPVSMRRWREISAAAAPMSVSARRSSAPRPQHRSAPCAFLNATTCSIAPCADQKQLGRRICAGLSSSAPGCARQRAGAATR